MSNPKMKPEVKEAWLEALRSGEYAQGEGTLHKITPEGQADEFCCLGVLCDLAYKAGAVDRIVTNTYEGPRYWYGEGTETNGGMPPQEVVDWAFEGGNATSEYLGHLGTKVVDGETFYNEVWLPSLNDYTRLSFESIARVIEEEDI